MQVQTSSFHPIFSMLILRSAFVGWAVDVSIFIPHIFLQHHSAASKQQFEECLPCLPSSRLCLLLWVLALRPTPSLSTLLSPSPKREEWEREPLFRREERKRKAFSSFISALSRYFIFLHFSFILNLRIFPRSSNYHHRLLKLFFELHLLFYEPFTSCW